MKERLPVSEDAQITILLAEDDPNLGSFLRTYLNNKGYKTYLCRDGESAYEVFLRGGFNFLITDIMMPKKDGFALARDVRRVDMNIPILFLTAKTLETDRLRGFQMGADDYLTKPFSMDELLLRIRAILRRTMDRNKGNVQMRFDLGDAVFDVTSQKLISNRGEEVSLTGRETDLLKAFCLTPNEVVERKEILVNVWKVDNYFNARSMDVYINKLRKALRQVCSAEIINVHGVGYRLVV